MEERRSRYGANHPRTGLPAWRKSIGLGYELTQADLKCWSKSSLDEQYRLACSHAIVVKKTSSRLESVWDGHRRVALPIPTNPPPFRPLSRPSKTYGGCRESPASCALRFRSK